MEGGQSREKVFNQGYVGKGAPSPAEQWDVGWGLLRGGLEADTHPWALAASLTSHSSSSPRVG